MVTLIDVEEIKEIFDNFEKMKKKGEGNDNSDEARVSKVLCKNCNILLILCLSYREFPWRKKKETMSRYSSKTRNVI